MLLFEVSLAVIRSRKYLTTTLIVTGEGTFAVNGIYMATEIFVQCEPYGMFTASDITRERTLVALGVFTSSGVSVKSQVQGKIRHT
jgi:hypothetical protein